MRKVIRFPRANGEVLVVTPVPGDPFRSTTHFEDANGEVIPNRDLFTEIQQAYDDGKFK